MTRGWCLSRSAKETMGGCLSGVWHHEHRAAGDAGYRYAAGRGICCRARAAAAQNPSLPAGDCRRGWRDGLPGAVSDRRGAVVLGLQPERIGESAVFVLPNPSGRNAALQLSGDASGLPVAGPNFTTQSALANMSDVPENRSAGVALNERAMESLEFIRTTMARSAPFTYVRPRRYRDGAAGHRRGNRCSFRGLERTVAWHPDRLRRHCRARRPGDDARQGAAMSLGCGLRPGAGSPRGSSPSIIGGAVLTVALVRADAIELVPAAWLLLYGAGVLAGSSSSVPVLAWLGTLFMAFGTPALYPAEWRDLWLASGFGVLQIAFGAYIARNHGG